MHFLCAGTDDASRMANQLRQFLLYVAEDAAAFGPGA